jgi:hypothetical protein
MIMTMQFPLVGSEDQTIFSILIEGEAALVRFKVFHDRVVLDMKAAHGSTQIHTMDPIPYEDSSSERACDVPQSADRWEPDLSTRDGVDQREVGLLVGGGEPVVEGARDIAPGEGRVLEVDVVNPTVGPAGRRGQRRCGRPGRARGRTGHRGQGRGCVVGGGRVWYTTKLLKQKAAKSRASQSNSSRDHEMEPVLHFSPVLQRAVFSRAYSMSAVPRSP